MKSLIQKTLIIIVLAFSPMINLVAQYCGTSLTEKHMTYMDSTRLARSNNNRSLNSISNEIYVLRIAAFVIQRSDGTGGLKYEDLQKSVENLNRNFSKTKMRFELAKLSYINNDNAYKEIKKTDNCNDSDSSIECILGKANYIPNLINIFFAPNIGLWVNGWSSFPGDKEDKNWIFIKNKIATNGKTLAHEMGHYFNLYHTHQSKSEELPDWKYELVDRSNCGLAGVGDELCDTPAEPYLGGYGISNYIGNYCQFTCKDSDYEGNKYQPFWISPKLENVYNTMSYAPPYCNHEFSPQQIQRMHESLEYDRRELISENACNTIFSEFTWLERSISCTMDSIIAYDYKDIIKFVKVRSGNDTKLYLMDGQQLCINDEECFHYFQSTIKEVSQKCVCIDNCTLIGCTDMGALNYNPYADCNDHTLCDYDVKGCINENACNFSMEATIDDGSCNYGDSACDDPCDTCIDCSKNQGIFTLGRCGRSFNYVIRMVNGTEYIPVFDEILSFPIKQGTKVNFDYEPAKPIKGDISICDSQTKIKITCIEEVIENRPEVAANYGGIDEGLVFSDFTAEALTNFDVSIYPNPTKGKFNVIINNELIKNTKISIYNLLGKKIEADTMLELKKGIIAFDLSAQPKGVYFIEIDDSFKAYTNKIILK